MPFPMDGIENFDLELPLLLLLELLLLVFPELLLVFPELLLEDLPAPFPPPPFRRDRRLGGFLGVMNGTNMVHEKRLPGGGSVRR